MKYLNILLIITPITLCVHSLMEDDLEEVVIYKELKQTEIKSIKKNKDSYLSTVYSSNNEVAL